MIYVRNLEYSDTCPTDVVTHYEGLQLERHFWYDYDWDYDSFNILDDLFLEQQMELVHDFLM